MTRYFSYHHVSLVLVHVIRPLALSLQFVLGGLGLSTADDRRDDAQRALTGGRHQCHVDQCVTGTLLERLTVNSRVNKAES